MPAKIPAKVKDMSIISSLEKFLINQGKVRDIYQHPENPQYLLFVASNRISIFDFVLSALVPFKGWILTALTHFWLTDVLKDFPHHLVNDDQGRNASFDLLEKYPGLSMRNSLVIRKVEIQPFEMVFRHHLGGSVYKDYLKNGIVCGQKLIPNIRKWSFLEEPLFTPTTKSETGHDKPVDVQYYFEKMGFDGMKSRQLFIDAYKKAYNFARSRGILILDTKFEGLDSIADEVLTPDSSRFTTVEDWEKAMNEGKDPVFYDKEPVREWGKSVDTPWGKGINSLDPENEEQITFVHNLTVPQEVINAASERYRNIFEMITIQSISKYQRNGMLIPPDSR